MTVAGDHKSSGVLGSAGLEAAAVALLVGTLTPAEVSSVSNLATARRNG